MPKVKITITGERVHGVGYRLFIFEEADALFIQNFDAKNVGKWAVVALAEGDETQVKKFTDFCGSNFPADASVGDVSVEGYEGKIKSIDSFRDSLSINQLSKIARVGVDMLGKQDAMLGKQDDIIEVIKNEGEKTRDTLTKHLGDDITELRQEIASIKATLSRVLEKVEA
ncbi:MAG: acylphosphatase [Candidatus Hydrothermarchaeaceae archaeon]